MGAFSRKSQYRNGKPVGGGGHGRAKGGGGKVGEAFRKIFGGNKRRRTPVGPIDQHSKNGAEDSEEAEIQVSNQEMQEELAADGVEGTEEHDLLSAASEELEHELAAKAEADLEEEEKTETSEDPSKASVPAGSSKASVPAGSAKQNRPSGAGEFRPDIIDNPVPIYPIEGYTSGRIPIPPQLQGLSPDQIQFSKVDGKMTARDRVRWRAAEQTARGTQRRNELDLIAREKERDIREKQRQGLLDKKDIHRLRASERQRVTALLFDKTVS